MNLSVSGFTGVIKTRLSEFIRSAGKTCIPPIIIGMASRVEKLENMSFNTHYQDGG